MRGENSALIFFREHAAGVEHHPQVCGMGYRFGNREDHVDRNVFTLVFVGADIAASIPGMAKMLTHGGLPVDLTRGNVVSHSVNLVVGEPELSRGGVEIMSDGVPDAAGINFALGAILIHPDHTADTPLAECVQMLARCHIIGLAQRDIELAVRTNIADPRGMVVTYKLPGDQLALGDDCEPGLSRGLEITQLFQGAVGLALSERGDSEACGHAENRGFPVHCFTTLFGNE